MRRFRPTATGLLLLLPIGCAVVVWLAWEPAQPWQLFTLPLVVAAALLVGARVEGSEDWEPPRWAPYTLLLAPFLAVGLGIAFSLLNWGYAWHLPRLDARVRDVEWTSVARFTSAADGTSWELRDSATLDSPRERPESDAECCHHERILDVVGARRGMSSQELKKLEPEILSVVTLETGEPGYDKHARELRGVVATGTTADGSAVAFAAFTGRQISNDHYATHEVFVTRSPTQALDVRNYYSDIAGAEFMSARVVTFAALPFAIGVMPFIIVAGAIIRGSLRFIRSGRSRCSPANGPRSSRR